MSEETENWIVLRAPAGETGQIDIDRLVEKLRGNRLALLGNELHQAADVITYLRKSLNTTNDAGDALVEKYKQKCQENAFKPVKASLALAWLGNQRDLELRFHSPVYADDDDQSEEWRVYRESGSINDREWDQVGAGETPLVAIEAARAFMGVQ